jgi:hypothetical protein
MNFQEEFLHFIWWMKLYGVRELRTTTGDRIEVIRQGILNRHAGPDFSNARIKIGATTWVGNVEIHLRSSDWLVHRHQFDPAYENVILHVVDKDDTPIYRKDGTPIPALVLGGLFPLHLQVNYEKLIAGHAHFPCEKQIKTVDPFLIENFLSGVLIERLAVRSVAVYRKLDELKGNWDETFYHFIARSFGFKVNGLPMEMLARSLPQQILAKHKDNPLQIEALIFGQAGFLDQPFEHDYPLQLKREYRFLKKKYSLQPISISLWKFMRMRPQNFPTLRLAQFAALIVSANHLFSKVLIIKEHYLLSRLFNDLPVNEFWKTHYHFNKSAENVHVQLGEGSINNLIINALVLFLFAYGKYAAHQQLIDKAITLLENMPAENNAVIQQYLAAGVPVRTAFNSQALLQLKKTYCNEKKCLNCGIGIKILNK